MLSDSEVINSQVFLRHEARNLGDEVGACQSAVQHEVASHGTLVAATDRSKEGGLASSAREMRLPCNLSMWVSL